MTQLVTEIAPLAKSDPPVPAQRDGMWVLSRCACYFRGRGVTFGAPLVPQGALAQNVYSLNIGLVKTNVTAGLDSKLDLIAQGSLDHLFIGPQLHALEAPQAFLKDAAWKVQVGGHIMILGEDQPPSPELKVVTPEGVLAVLATEGKWQLKSHYSQDGKWLLILKRVEGRRGVIPIRPRSGKKRALIARYGALGDAIMVTPLIKALYEDGYEVSLNISSYCAPALENNPYISNLLVQEREIIPNPRLGDYWGLWAKEYDKYINLSESIEGDLLFVEGRGQFFTTQQWRHEKANKNYFDYTLRRGGYPERVGQKGELFFTPQEEKRARGFWQGPEVGGRFTLVWALNGSSHHKVYPLMEATLREWFSTHPDSRVITVGDYAAKLLEFEHPQLLQRAGVWSIRESLIAAKYASCVIGPETMMTNAAGCFPTPKITLLSHSTHENLCKYWENDYCLSPDQTVAQCYPCHSLHYTRESCPVGQVRDESQEVVAEAPICTISITPERVLGQLEKIYACWKEGRTPQSSDRIDREDFWKTQSINCRPS